jgi:hypothetical protein
MGSERQFFSVKMIRLSGKIERKQATLQLLRAISRRTIVVGNVQKSRSQSDWNAQNRECVARVQEIDVGWIYIK